MLVSWIEAIDAGLLGWLAAMRTPALDGFFAAVTSNPISLAGSALTTVAAFLFLLLFSIHLVSEHATTLFVTGPKFRAWGFMTARGWVPWQEYLG